ncbi:MAG: 16S rRNA processing protein RimM, partial [Muribaculaceae bacterium]|nr:16S rRNA processing protein RimM [Muribaculaceae bacterium]
MIRENELRVVGRLLKPHGICGEITALITGDVDLTELNCIVLRLDGIFVPFFLEAVRPKSSETDLLTINGISDETQAARLCPNDIYAL